MYVLHATLVVCVCFQLCMLYMLCRLCYAMLCRAMLCYTFLCMYACVYVCM